jgi:hypothetical protein
MRLDPKEARLIAELRATPTGKITAVKFKGEIRAVKIEVDLAMVDKASGAQSPFGVSRGTAPGEMPKERKVIRISEPMKPASAIENIEETDSEDEAATDGI